MGKKADKKPSKKSDKSLKAEKKEKKSKRKGASKKPTKLSPKARLEMVATAAYYIAEEHGFTPGRAETDWLEAERQIEASLKKSK
jgi:hypothetical protein